MALTQLDLFFKPNSVALLGASNDPRSLGYNPLRNLLELGFKGRIYPVNPKYQQVQGLKCYASVEEIPESVDLAIITVPNLIVPSLIEQCASKQIKAVIIHSSGFRESGPEGAQLEQRILRIARQAGIRIAGPNTTGTLDTSSNFTSTFVAIPRPRPGPISFIAQSGMFAGAMLEWMMKQNLGLARVFGLGNKLDVDESEALEYLSKDPGTKLIAMYLEDIRDGRRFLEIARKVSRTKPILLLKSGRTRAGAEAAATHTGSMLVDDRILDGLCHQAGILRVDDFDQLVDLAKALAMQPIPQGNRVAVASMSGGAGVTAVDACSRHGLDVVLPARARAQIEPWLPRWAKLGIYVDLEPLLETSGAECYRLALRALLSSDEVDCVLWSIFLTPWFSQLIEPEILEGSLAQLKQEFPGKPIIAHAIGERAWMDLLEKLGIPVYASIDRCAWIISKLVSYRSYLRASGGVQEQS